MPDFDLRAFAATWLPRLTAAANDTVEAQEALLAEFAAKLRELAPSAGGVADLLKVLSDSAEPVAERRQAAITFLESQEKPRRRAFWKR